MNRILELQTLTTQYGNPAEEADSTSSGNGCACSTASAALCYMADEIVAI